jgi:hypothetical protein
LVTVLWLLTGTALVLAAAALIRARRLSRRLERLTESYWELRYEHGQLRARLNRLDPQSAAPSDPSTSVDAPADQPRRGDVTFVPLSTLKR